MPHLFLITDNFRKLFFLHGEFSKLLLKRSIRLNNKSHSNGVLELYHEIYSVIFVDIALKVSWHS